MAARRLGRATDENISANGCHMAGRGCGYGSAVLLDPTDSQDPTKPGRKILTMFKGIKLADIGDERLRTYWRLEEELPDVAGIEETWSQIQSVYPAQAKSPGTYLCQCSVGELLERESGKSRKLFRVTREAGNDPGKRRMSDSAESHGDGSGWAYSGIPC